MPGRLGRGQFLTPEDAERVLAVPCFYILAGRAQPVFPHTSISGPSAYVRIIRLGVVLPRYHARLPVDVESGQWHKAVLPVLRDERWEVRQPLMKRALADGGIDYYINLIGADLRVSFTNAGY